MLSHTTNAAACSGWETLANRRRRCGQSWHSSSGSCRLNVMHQPWSCNACSTPPHPLGGPLQSPPQPCLPLLLQVILDLQATNILALVRNWYQKGCAKLPQNIASMYSSCSVQAHASSWTQKCMGRLSSHEAGADRLLLRCIIMLVCCLSCRQT